MIPAATYSGALKNAREKLSAFIRNSSSAFREAETILLYSTGLKREKLYTILRDPMPKNDLKRFMKLIKFRAARVPLQYITGSECFYGREFKVQKGVFIPRPDTESLIDAVKSIKGGLAGPVIVADCGSGSGIIPITLLKELDCIKKFYCFDTNKKALYLTLNNAINHGVSRLIRALKGDFFALSRRLRLKFSLVVSNPPYIKQKALKTLQKEVLYEPLAALTDGKEGFSFYQKFSVNAARFLKPGGYLVVEIGDGMGKKVRKVFNSKPWKFILAKKDFRGKERALVFKYVPE